MKKLFIIISMGFLFSACSNSNQPNSASDSNEITAIQTGDDVDLCKGIINSWVNADWETYRSYFTDTATIVHNAWWNEESAQMSIDDAIEFHKNMRPHWSSVELGDSIFEVVVNPDGVKFGHAWVKFNTTEVDGPSLTNIFQGSWQIIDGKANFEWGIYDTAKLPEM